MKIFTRAQIHELDKYTIEHEPIKSIDLMERAAKAITQAITDQWNSSTPVIVFAGPGNNGGDALAVARMLIDRNYDVTAYLFNISGHLSEDCSINKKRLEEKRAKALVEVIQEFDPPLLKEDMQTVGRRLCITREVHQFQRSKDCQHRSAIRSDDRRQLL